MDFDLSFLEEKGIDVKTGIEYTGNKEKYISALKRYLNSFEDNKNKLKAYLDSGDLDNYRIIVHALKSNSMMVGAMKLYEDFEKLENASREGDSSFVKESSDKIMSDYESFIELIRPVGKADIEPPADEIDGDKAGIIIEALLEALDNFDDEKSSALAKELSGYPFRIRQREMMEQAIKYIYDFMYDETAQIITELKDYIE